MHGASGAMLRFGVAALLSMGAFCLPDSAAAQAQIEAWQFGRDQLVVTGPRSLAILEDKGRRKELELDGNLAGIIANPDLPVVLVLTHDAQFDAEALAEPRFDPPFFGCEALLLTVP